MNEVELLNLLLAQPRLRRCKFNFEQVNLPDGSAGQAGTCLYGQGDVAVVLRSDGAANEYLSPLATRIQMHDGTVEDGPPTSLNGKFPIKMLLPRYAYIFGPSGRNWILERIESADSEEVHAVFRHGEDPNYKANAYILLAGIIRKFESPHLREEIWDLEIDNFSEDDEALLRAAADLDPVPRMPRIPGWP
jgi:hypothetical protein